MIETRYTVSDMSCAHCKGAIEESLNELSGIEKATADPDTKIVEVSYREDRVNDGKVKAAIEEAGYTVA